MSEHREVPLEMWDNIIDHLWDDLPALAACTLVCHAWRPSARRHLFHTVFLEGDGHARMRGGVYKTDTYHSPTYKDRQALLRVSPFIQKLLLDWGQSQKDFPQLDDELIPCFQAMSRVKTLDLRLLIAESTPLDVFAARLAQLPPQFVQSIRNISMGSIVMFPTFAHLAKLLSVFRYISELHCSLFALGSPHALTALPVPHDPLGLHLSKLVCDMVPSSAFIYFMRWLGAVSGMRYPPSLQLSLEHEHKSKELFVAYAAILHEFGPCLQHLWLARDGLSDSGC